MGKELNFSLFHEIRNFAIGQPNRYTYLNQLFVDNVAGAVQPAMGFGIHNVILSGIYAAEAIIKNKDYETLMKQQDKEYNWSLALRNTFELLSNEQLDWLVDGMNTVFGRLVLQRGGLNINRFAGRILSLLTREKKNSMYHASMKPFWGKSLDPSNQYHEEKL